MLIPSKFEGYLAGKRMYPGKSGGSSAPPPDPRLVDAQIKSMGIQDSAISRMMDLTNEMAPLQKEQMQFGLDSARTAYDQSQQDRTWMLDRRGNLTGLQDQQLADAKNFNSKERANELVSQATADVNSAFDSSQAQMNRGLDRRGVNPASGNALALANQNSIARAAALSSAHNQVRQAARQEGYQLTDRAANSLSGYPSMAMSATGAGAGYGASGLGLANSGLAGMNSGYSAAGGMAGSMGSNAAGMYGAMGSYKNGADQIANANDPWNTILGAAAGGAGAYGMSMMMPGKK